MWAIHTMSVEERHRVAYALRSLRTVLAAQGGRGVPCAYVLLSARNREFRVRGEANMDAGSQMETAFLEDGKRRWTKF